jgi:hypothetical protein
MRKLLLLFLLISSLIQAQTKTLTGIVADSLNIPLENANIIANPFDANAQLKFAIADNKGRYKLELDNNVKYEITVSYIGYKDAVLTLEPNTTITQHNFILKNTGEVLKEIVIKHDFKPIVIKKDTMTFNVKSFANGSERKMKEILEKLPGVEVDKKGQVTVQGKKVTKMLVEGKSFFGGGSKLAVENIPADALDKIEVIDNFNQVGFMKQVSDSDDLAMNVKLKAGKKKFVFGDIEAGIGNKPYYLGHAALFYYSPKSNISFIGDTNNIGKSTFTYDDLMRFDGGVSSFLSGRKSFSNLFAFAIDNIDVIQNKSQFSATNFSFDISPKFSISGYTIWSKVFTQSQTENKNTYLQNNAIAFENRFQNNNKRSVLGIGNLKLDYSPSEKEKVFYNMQFQSSNNNALSNISSITNLDTTLFKNSINADNVAIKQYLEWHKSSNEHHTTSFVVNQAYEDNTPQNDWITNKKFLAGLIPLQTNSNYEIQQVIKAKSNNLDALFKHYWIVNNFNHLYTNLGNNYVASSIKTSEKQILTNGNINDFSTAGFGNNIDYKLNDAYIGLEYKFKIGKWTNKPGVYFHLYHLTTNQVSGNYTLSKSLFQPQFNSEYEFNKSESLKFAYKLANTFPEVNQVASEYTLQSYNVVFKGNALLENEHFHNAVLTYTKMNMYRGITLNANAIYNKKIQTIRNQIALSGINQYSIPLLTNNPETNWRVMGTITKRIYKFSLKLNTNLNWLNYIQTLNNITSTNNRNSQTAGISIRTANRKWPDFNMGYVKGFNQIKGISNSQFQSDAFNVDFDITILKNWIFKMAYENLKNTNTNNQSNYYDIANASLRYQKKNSPFGFEFTANNFINATVKNSYTFSDYLISEQTTYVLPRVFLFSVSYKL